MKHSVLSCLRLGALAMVVAGAVGCGSDDTTGSSTGKLNVQMVDAAFPFSEVSRVDVFVVRIDAKKATTTDAAAEDATDMSGWTTIATPNSSFNLLSLQGGVTANLGTGTLPTGTYQGFRLIIDPAQSSVTLKDNSHPAITWPSASKTGIKINLDQPISVTADSSMMILDFDVGASFVMRGNSISQNGLLFKPVIRAVATDVTGSLAGVVRADNATTGTLLAGVTVEVLTAGSLLTDTDATHVVASTVTDANGAFKFDFLMPGTYVVRATPAASTTYLPALLVGGVTIANGQDVSGKVIVVTH
ncbi:MAG TPA: DUF4382 domain-containing protein [Gemmatimonadaceae bacterium]|nr:DUF4382 domain-containing protein [Gemmatimonadaceae bacterium]